MSGAGRDAGELGAHQRAAKGRVALLVNRQHAGTGAFDSAAPAQRSRPALRSGRTLRAWRASHRRKSAVNEMTKNVGKHIKMPLTDALKK